MISLGLVVSAMATITLYCRVGWPKARAGFAYMGIAGLAAFSLLIFRKDKGAVTFDERDKQIKRRAALASFALSYLFVGLACMIPLTVLGPSALIRVDWLGDIFQGTAITAFYTWAIAILIQYGGGGKENE
jgi:hypothetical protein